MRRSISGARGVIKAETETGWLADFHRPVAAKGVELSAEDLCLTREYADPRARTRISNQHCPNFPVRVGDSVAAMITTEGHETGQMVDNPFHDWSDYRSQRMVPEVEFLGGTATRWGITST